MAYLNILVLFIAIFPQALSYYTHFQNVTVEKLIIRSLAISFNKQEVLVISSDSGSNYFEVYGFEGRRQKTVSIDLPNSALIKSVFWNRNETGPYLLFQGLNNITTIIKYSADLVQVSQFSINSSIIAFAARSDSNSSHFSFCFPTSEWKQYENTDTVWTVSNSILLPNNFRYDQMSYTSDDTVICFAGWNIADATNWTLVCYNISNNKEKVFQNFISARKVSLASIQDKNEMMVFVNETFLYILALDYLTFTEEPTSYSNIYSIKSCKSTNPRQLVTFLSNDSSRSRLFLITKQEKVALYQSIYFESSSSIQSYSLAVCEDNYIIGFSQRNFFILEDESFAIGIFAVILLVYFSIIFLIVLLFIYKKQRYVFLKNLKIYYRSKKLLSIFITFFVTFGTLWLMLYLFRQDIFITQTCICYFVQYFLLILVITIYQCKTEHDEINKYLIMYRLKGISISTYLLQRTTYLLLLVFLLSVINTTVIALIPNNYIRIQGLQDFMIIVYAFILCSLSNIGFGLILSVIIKNFNVLVQIIFFFHFIGLLAMSLSKDSNYLQFYVYFSGIYNYYDIFNSCLDHYSINDIFLATRMGKGFFCAGVQTIFYLSMLFFIVVIKNRFKINKGTISKQSLLANFDNGFREQIGIITVKNLNKKKGKLNVLKDISFTIKKGDCFVIYGSNQTGKTTLINALLSLQNVDSGSILYRNGLKIECCLQSYSCFEELSFVQHIHFLCNVKNVPKTETALLTDTLINNFNFVNDAHKRASELSGGSLKKLCLALTFVGKPDLIILDEPSLGIDGIFKTLFWSKLKQDVEEKKLTVIVTTSSQDEARLIGGTIYEMNKEGSQFYEDQEYSIIFKPISEIDYTECQQDIKQSPQQYEVSLQGKQIRVHVAYQQLLGESFIHNYIFRTPYLFDIRRCSPQKIQLDTEALQNLVTEQHQMNKSCQYIKRQIIGLLARRWHIFTYSLWLTFFTITIHFFLLFVRQVLYDPTITAFLLLIRFYIYFENGVIRNEQIVKMRYKNVLIFGMNKPTYWIFSIIPDAIILFLVIELVYGANVLIRSFITQVKQGFGWNLCFNLLFFSILYVGVIYFLTNLISNYLTYLFFFFYFNGFCFYFVLYSHYIQIDLPEVLKYFYFSLTFYLFNIDPKDQTLLIYLIYQLLVWYLLLFLQLFLPNYLTFMKKNPKLSSTYFKLQRDKLFEQYAIEDIEDQSKVPLIIDQVFHSYDNSTYVIKNISLHIKPGEIFGLIGLNGAGKTTLFSIMTGILQPSAGQVKYFGKSLHSMGFRDHIGVGYCPQFDYLYDVLTVEQNFYYLGRIKGMTDTQIASFAKRYLEYFQMYGHLKEKVCKLSGGNRRKVSFILAFIGNPRLIFLDQPCSGLDRKSKTKLWNLVYSYCNQQRASAILTTHYVSQIEKYCTRIGILKEGTLISINRTSLLVRQFSNEYQLIIQKPERITAQQIIRTIEQNVILSKRIIGKGNKITFTLSISTTIYKQILSRFFLLLREGSILSFEFFCHNLQNVVSLIKQTSSILTGSSQSYQ